MGERIQICTRQPKNLQRLSGGFTGEPIGLVKKCPQMQVATSATGCKVSCPIINESKVFIVPAQEKQTESNRN